jgi:L-rhamnose isomerase / sugar isomerase
MVLSVVNLQEAYAKALLVDRDAVAAAQAAGDVLGGHEALLDAYRTDVRPLCAKVRAERGAAEDPVAAHRASGYVERISNERGATAGVAGGWGR